VKRQSRFRFRLYVARDAPNSEMALTNFASLCDTYLRDRYEIEVIDVFEAPHRALADRVFMTPTLMRLGPGSPLSIVGSLSDTRTVLQALGLDGFTSDDPIGGRDISMDRAASENAHRTGRLG
jgi:circadian clock protein KaiB